MTVTFHNATGTSLAGLFAAGEIACTGVHGANRLASNSLLEAVVFTHRAAKRLKRDLAELPPPDERAVEFPDLSRDGVDASIVEDQIRSLMWDKVGIVRSDERLEQARETLDGLSAVPIASDGTGPGAFRARQIEFMRDVATLIVRSAQRRRESRGLHYTESHPHRDNERFLRDTVLSR